MFRFAIATVLILLVGCDRRTPAPSATTRPTIASTVPAATDLIVGMGARDQLVAVSTYDRERADVGSLPKAGDYQSVDWELMATLRPSVLLTFMAPDREPAGFRQRAADLHIDLLNVNVDHLSELKPAIEKLGAALGNPAMAMAANRTLDQRFDAVTARVAGRPLVSALIVLSPDATAVAGVGTVLDDVLHVAGGVNATVGLRRAWPTVDRELLLSLHPTVVLQLVTDGTPQALAQAKATWAQLPTVAPGRVYFITDPYAVQPGWHLPDLAERFAQCLHPSNAPTSAP